MNALGEWSQHILLVGDAGRNSETALVYDDFISAYSGPLTVTRDAIDLVKNNNHLLVERENTTLILSFAQLQKVFQSVYYPKMITFSMQLAGLVEALHKFTLTYPVTLVTLHKEHLIIAHGGDVVTQAWDSPLRIWRGETAARAAAYLLWTPSKPLQAISASVVA
jgi:hypothetical protein